MKLPESIEIPVGNLPLTFLEVTAVNAARCEVWHAEMEPWSLADWSNAAAGEMGEACNVVKKIRRQETGMRGAVDPEMDVLKEKLADEIADTFLYLDLLATHAGVNLAEAIARKFNAVSDREATMRPQFTKFKINYPRPTSITVDLAFEEGDVS